MASNILISLVFAGIIQGIILGVFILTSKKHKSKASLYLGLLILCFTLSNLQYTADEIELINWDTFNLIYLPYLFFTPPFLYFFVVYYLNPDRAKYKLELLLFIPAVASLIITLTYKAIALVTLSSYRDNPFLELLGDIIDRYGDFANIFLFFTVIVLSFININSYKKKQLSFNKDIVLSQLLWLKILLAIFLVVLFPWFVFTYNYFYNEDTLYLPMFLIASIVIYLLGYIGIHKIGVLKERKKIKSYLKDQRNLDSIIKPKNEHIAHLEKIVFKDQGYLNPNLTLDSLTEALQLSKSHLSRIINTELNMSFSDYVNSLRVSEAKKLLLNPEFSKYTLVAIGLESGFNSKTTFNTVFKKRVGMSPSQFKNKND